MTDLTDSIHTYLTTAPTSGFAGLSARVIDTWRGEENQLWRALCNGSDVVIKLFLDAGQARGRRQFDGQHTFAPMGIAPEPLWFDRVPEGLPRPVLVYEWAEGRPIDPDDGEAMAAFAESAALVHSSDQEGAQRLSPRPVNLTYFWRMLSGGIQVAHHWLAVAGCPYLAPVLQAIGDRAELLVDASLPLWRATQPALIHGNLRFTNALFDGRRSILLDWDMFGLGDPALEVAAFLSDSQQEVGVAARAAWLHTYFKGSTAPDMADRIAVYERLLPLQRLSFLLNGLRQLSASERQEEAYRDSAGFLAETILAAGERAADALGAGAPFATDDAHLEIARLIL